MNTKTSSKLKRHLGESLRQVRHCYRQRLERCQKKFSAKSVHDLRVETRRLLVLLELLAALKCVEIHVELRKNLKKRLDQFGDLRDVHVQMELLKPLWVKFPEAQGVKTILQRREQKLETRLAGKIEKTKVSDLNRQLKQLEKCVDECSLGKKPLNAEVAPALRETFQRVDELRLKIQPGDAASIHKVRIAFKCFRYLNELLQPVLPAITDEQLKRMKEFQDRAGAIQDLEVLLARLAATVKDRKLNPIALRNLRNELLQRKHQAMSLLVDHMDDLSKFQPGTKPLRVRPQRTRA